MKILVTAFEPFNDDINYSEIVLNEIITNKQIIKHVLPVEYFNSFKKLKDLIQTNNPNTIIMLGEARNYKEVGFEVIGINEFSNRPDNNNFIPKTRKIIKNGADGLFSTLDYNLFEKCFQNNNAKQFRSFSAGTYVCNALLYQTLSYIKDKDLNIKCGFIHVPILTKENKRLIIKSLNEYLSNQ